MASKIKNTTADVVNQAANVSGLFATKPTAKYTSGARTIIKINNKVVAFAFGITWRVTTDWTEIMTIDDYMPAELAPRRIMVDGTIQAFHIPGQGAVAQGWQADQISFLFNKYITIEVRDSATDQLMFYAPQAAITTRQEDLMAENLGKVSLSFKAIGWKDETEPQSPDSFKTNKD